MKLPVRMLGRKATINDGNMNQLFHSCINDQPVGPLDADAVLERIERRAIARKAMAWCEDMVDGCPVTAIATLALSSSGNRSPSSFDADFIDERAPAASGTRGRIELQMVLQIFRPDPLRGPCSFFQQSFFSQ